LKFRSIEYPSYVEFSACGNNLGVGAWGKGFVCTIEEFLSNDA
jgi:hypothetical protein